MQVLKHLLTTASFAKKFMDPTNIDPNKYVTLVRYSILYTKLRHSQVFPRTITFKQGDKLKSKNLLKLIVKYRDYATGLQMVDHFNMRHLMSAIYEDWCQNMIKHSEMREEKLEEMFRERFIHLAKKLAVDQGFSYA